LSTTKGLQMQKNDVFEAIAYRQKGRDFHKAITRGSEEEVGWTRNDVINMIGEFLTSCQEFGLDPIPHLSKLLPRFVWRSYNTDEETNFNYGIALDHTDIVFFLNPVVVTMKWQKKNYSRSNLLHLCWVSERAEMCADIREIIARCHSKQVNREKN
jgi:hypothetical protein